MLAPLSQFVVGNGAAQGFALSHPRLNEFFASPDFAGANDLEVVGAAFLGWGAETANRLNAGELPAERSPSYLLRHYGHHLSQSKIPSKAFSKLLGKGWAEAWYTLDPSYRGLLSDVQRSWDAFAADPCSRIGDQVRCLLYFGSLQSPYQLPPSAVFAAALDAGTLTSNQVLNILSFGIDRSDFDERAEQLAGILTGEAGVALADLLDLRPPMIGKVRALAALANELQGADRVRIADRATRAARSCADPFEHLCAAALVLPFRPPGVCRR